MGRPKLRSPEAATIDRLLAAAAAEFARRGFEGARLQDIAEAAGITRPSLLYHFASKQDLYTAVVRDVFGALGEVLIAGTAVKGPFPDRVDDILCRLFAFFERRPEVATLILRELLDGKGPGHALLLEVGVPILERIERFIREEGRESARSDGPVREALLQIFCAVLVRTAAGPLVEPLWGKTNRTSALARILLLKE